MKRFTRLALGFSKKLERPEDAVALYMAYFNFTWRPETLKGAEVTRDGLNVSVFNLTTP